MPELNFQPGSSRDADLIEGSSPLGEARYAAANYVRSNFAKVVALARNGEEKIVITEHSKPACAVVPITQYRILTLLERAGLTSEISELTYKSIPIDEMISELIEMMTLKVTKTRSRKHDRIGASDSSNSDDSSQPRARNTKRTVKKSPQTLLEED
jgi:prevent-host-death family protein